MLKGTGDTLVQAVLRDALEYAAEYGVSVAAAMDDMDFPVPPHVRLEVLVRAWLASSGVNVHTISFYSVGGAVDGEAEEAEAFFGTCEITGVRGNVVPCQALDADGELISFEAGDWLVHGVLGKLAGAF